MGKNKSFTEKVDEELAKRLSETTDEGTEGGKKPKEEVTSEDKDKAPAAAAPKPKTPEEMAEDPNKVLNPEVVKEMGAATTK